MVTQTQPQVKANWVIDPVHSAIEFAVKHMMISTVRGRFTKFDVDIDFDETNPERSRIEAKIEVASIDTKEPQRDAHLRSPDFFDVEKFPWIIFKSRRIHPLGNGRYELVGDLTIRDVTREVTLDTTFTEIVRDPWGNQRGGFTAESRVNRKDFGLTWNMVLEAGGLLVGDTAKITIEGELVRQNG